LDVLEIHLAHGYLLNSFLAPKQNRRKDQWGGSLQNRARFARDVVRAVRAEVGDHVAVTAKFGMTEGSPVGFAMNESLQVARWLQDDGHLDALELSAGSSLLNPMYLFRGDVPLREFAETMPPLVRAGLRTPIGKKFFRAYPFEEAFLRDKALTFREALSMPLVMLGGINDRATLDRAMTDGFEFVAMARALLREPDLVNRMQAGETSHGVCIHCNQCMPTIYTRTRCTIIDPEPVS
ncbi:MAG TPA: NADH:flavin oxidoreductase, partial [Aeromicrobium sp.]|nr:NADH:flavin oxidoreductase [Aeromicrobium sp.]